MLNHLQKSFLLLVMLTSTACTVLAQDPPSIDRTTQPQEFSNNHVLRAWLNCEECQEGQLEQVVQLGNSILPQLEQVWGVTSKYLAQDSLVGVDAFQLKYMARRASESYAALSEMNPEFRERIDEQRYVDTVLRRLLHRYQSRATIALQQIGTVEAKAVLAE